MARKRKGDKAEELVERVEAESPKPEPPKPVDGRVTFQLESQDGSVVEKTYRIRAGMPNIRICRDIASTADLMRLATTGEAPKSKPLCDWDRDGARAFLQELAAIGSHYLEEL